MKSAACLLLPLLLGSASMARPLAGSESSLTGAELSVCDARGSKCLSVTSESTVGSQVKALHRLRNPRAVLVDRKQGTSKVFSTKTGYVDLDNDQIVLIDRQGSRLKEIIFNMSTLERTESGIR